MVKTLFKQEQEHFEWVDVLAPSADELRDIAKIYGIHPAFITDVLEPEHLPKYEPVANTSFFIMRYYSPDEKKDIDTIQGLTNKIAIFQTDNLILSIHLFPIDFLKEIQTNLEEQKTCASTLHVLNKIFKAVLITFDRPASELEKKIDQYEAKAFLKVRKLSLSGVYHVKRKIEVSKKVLMLSREIVEKVDIPSNQDPETRDTRDLYVRLMTLYESMSENTNHLLTAYFSISSQRTNEVIRVLTLFSVFFMPLTFIVGIYGMNFKTMPEIDWYYGYPAIWLVMIGISVTIYLWFKRKGWL